MIPTVGRVVHYRVSAEEAAQITERHRSAGGNYAQEGDVYPLLITRVWGDQEYSSFNGTLFLDGPNSTLWITSTHIGDGPRHCFWPPRVG